MANINLAVNFVLRQEDSKLSGVITEATSDNGGRTRFGVAEKYHPDLTNTGFYDRMDYSDALETADSIYKNAYAVPLKLISIVDQNVANALLSFAINLGTGTCVKLCQKLLGLVQDGILGQQTLAGINSMDTTHFLSELGILASAYYEEIAKHNPSQYKFLAGWLNRVDANCQVG